jgi:hypothetical protein
VQHEVCQRHGQEHAGHPADHEVYYEPQRPQHRRVEADAPAVHGEQPVIDLNARADRDGLVAIPNAALTSAPASMVKKWCSQTVNETTQMNRVAATIER